MDYRSAFAGVGQALFLGSREIDDEADHCDRLKRKLSNSNPAYLDQSLQRECRTHQQAAMTGLELDAIVSDQACEMQEPAAASIDQCVCKPRLSGSGVAANEHRASASQNRGGVNGRSVGQDHIAGSRTAKRAPTTV